MAAVMGRSGLTTNHGSSSGCPCASATASSCTWRPIPRSADHGFCSAWMSRRTWIAGSDGRLGRCDHRHRLRLRIQLLDGLPDDLPRCRIPSLDEREVADVPGLEELLEAFAVVNPTTLRERTPADCGRQHEHPLW